MLDVARKFRECPLDAANGRDMNATWTFDCPGESLILPMRLFKEWFSGEGDLATVRADHRLLWRHTDGLQDWPRSQTAESITRTCQ
jgi:hypothetical protein